MSLTGGKVLITGATGGLGQAIARAFAGRGADLLISGRRVDLLDELAAEVGGRTLPCDLASREEVERLAAEAAQAGVEVLVANAAAPGAALLTETSQEEIDAMLEVNLRAPVTLARALLPGMIGRGRGHLVFISSLQGRATTPGAPIYCATKFGLRGFALAMREDLRGTGVGVSVVMPGFIREAGMFAETGVRLPVGVGTRPPTDVARAVLRAIERNVAELDVAPLGLSLGSKVASVAPALAAAVSRLMGSQRIAADMRAAQRGS